MPIVTNGDVSPEDSRPRRRAPRKKKRGDRRRDWHVNHASIEEAYIEYFKEHRRFPSARMLAKLTGFNRNTINDHINNLDVDRLIGTSPFRLLLPGILQRMAMKVYSDPEAPLGKMVLQLMGVKFENEAQPQAAAKTFKAYSGFDPDQV
jgi:hypothetical protein